jgi:hypothetical protein
MLVLHHIGTLVDDIAASVKRYQSLFPHGRVSDKTYVSSQGVYVCLIEVAPEVYLELIEPAREDSIVAGLKKKGMAYYHLSYQTDDFEKTTLLLLELNFKQINLFHSEAFENKRCSFFMSPDMHLIEIVEM